MNFIKYHWFGMVISLFFAIFILVFVLVLISPRQDLQKRGFVPCTETMANELFACQNNKAYCMTKVILQNSWCDTKVIGDGLKLWANGEQKTPWANYIFTPKLAEPEIVDEGLSEFYDQTPDVETSMDHLKKLNTQLESKVQKSEVKSKEINHDKQE